MKAALVIGCSMGVWDDVEAAFRLSRFDRVYCVKLAGVYWPEEFDVWVTLHPEYMDDYEARRHAKGYPGGYEIVAPLEGEVEYRNRKKGRVTRRVSYRWKGMNSSASSGIYGAKVARDDGCDRVVLAGIPMSDEPHFARGRSSWEQRDSFLPGLEVALPHMRGWCRSVSGLTSEKLGVPTPEWLAGG